MQSSAADGLRASKRFCARAPKDVVDVIGSVTRDAPRSARKPIGRVYPMPYVSPIGPENVKSAMRAQIAGSRLAGIRLGLRKVSK